MSIYQPIAGQGIAVPPASLRRRALAEAVGTALLALTVVGSGLSAARLSPGDAGVRLLEVALATGAALAALVVALGPVSGAHLNPAVSVAAGLRSRLPWSEVGAYAVAQVLGAVAGVVVANLTFGHPAVGLAGAAPAGAGPVLAEAVATFGLVVVVVAASRSQAPSATALAIGAYVAAAHWFASSTGFANPALSAGRALTDSAAGLARASVAPFVAAQLAGAAAAVAVAGSLWPRREPEAGAASEVGSG